MHPLLFHLLLLNSLSLLMLLLHPNPRVLNFQPPLLKMSKIVVKLYYSGRYNIACLCSKERQGYDGDDASLRRGE